MPKKKGMGGISDILVLLGAVIALIFGILDIVGIGSLGLGIFSINTYIPGFGLIVAVILIIFSLITLATTEVIKFPWKFKKNWTMLFVLGIILFILGGGIGAVLVMLGAILLLF